MVKYLLMRLSKIILITVKCTLTFKIWFSIHSGKFSSIYKKIFSFSFNTISIGWFPWKLRNYYRGNLILNQTNKNIVKKGQLLRLWGQPQNAKNCDCADFTITPKSTVGLKPKWECDFVFQSRWLNSRPISKKYLTEYSLDLM